MKKIISTIFAGVAVAAMALAVSASPAMATANTLPANNSLYVVDSSGSGVYEMDATGAQTLLDIQLNDNSQGSLDAGALSPIDNHAYLVYNPGDPSLNCAIDKIDLLGGAASPRVTVSNGGDTIGYCFGLNIDASGNALLTGFNAATQLSYIWHIDLSTGDLTTPIAIEDELFGFTVSPSGDWVGLRQDGTLVSIDKVSGAFTTLVATTLNDAYDCKFDSDGTLWFTNEAGAPYELYSWRSGDTDYTFQGAPNINGDTGAGMYGPVFVGYSTQKISDVEAAKNATLPDTGVTTDAAWIALGLLVAAGGILALRRWVRATR